MRLLRIFLQIICAACVAASSTQPATSHESLTLVKDLPHGFELSYPAGWKAEKPFVGEDHVSDIPVRLNVPEAGWMSVAVGDTNIPAD